jgi:hypothetical protein
MVTIRYRYSIIVKKTYKNEDNDLCNRQAMLAKINNNNNNASLSESRRKSGNDYSTTREHQQAK